MSADHRRYDAVVVGSGFGGSITALRLAQAGRRVLVLERGRRWRPGSFPRDVRQTNEVFWRHPQKAAATGLYEVRFHSGLATVTASGVGGGSLIYANIHIRPDADVFEDPRWPRSYSRGALDPYYDRVATRLGVAPVPESRVLPKRDRLRAAAQSLGEEIFDPDQAVAWQTAAGPGRAACQYCAECEFGCNHGAKNTLDFTYLAEAEKLGAEIRAGVLVSHVAPEPSGYRVHLTDVATGEPGWVAGRQVILSAGTLGTNEILFRSRDTMDTLPAVSSRLGIGYSGNGDFLGTLRGTREPLAPWRGPDVTSVIKSRNAGVPFTLAAPTFNQPVMTALAALGPGHPEWVRPFAGLIWPALNWLVPLAFRLGFLNSASERGDPAVAERMTNLFAIGRDTAGGRLVWEKGRLDIQWDYARENARLISAMEMTMGRLAACYGGEYSPLPTWQIFRKILTVHSLGGCHLSETPNEGVVSPDGEVHGYPGLFVADGSLVPTAIGFHPVMTIAAVCERIAERIAAR